MCLTNPAIGSTPASASCLHVTWFFLSNILLYMTFKQPGEGKKMENNQRQIHAGDPWCSALLHRSVPGILPPEPGCTFIPGVQTHGAGMPPGPFLGGGWESHIVRHRSHAFLREAGREGATSVELFPLTPFYSCSFTSPWSQALFASGWHETPKQDISQMGRTWLYTRATREESKGKYRPWTGE